MRESDAPSPWKSLGCFGVRLFCALILAVILWGGWYAYAAHRLNAKLAEYRARGEPVSAEDLNDPPVDPVENRYDLLVQAADNLEFNPAQLELVDSPTAPGPIMLPLSAAQMQTAREMMDDNADVTKLINQAAEAKKLAFPPLTNSELLLTSSEIKLGKLRRLVNFCRAESLYYHQNHEDVLAIDVLHRMGMIASVVDHHAFLIDHLVALAAQGVVATTLLHISPDLQIKSVDVSSGASRESVEAMTRELLDLRPLQDGLVGAFQRERIFTLDITNRRTVSEILLRPALRMDACRSLEECDAFIRTLAAGIPTFVSAKPRFPISHHIETNMDSITYSLSGDMFSLFRVTLLHYRTLIDRQAAALRLAIRLYEFDHNGEIPKSLTELVPRYVLAIPVDTFRPDGGPLTYSSERRVFYSVGENGIDDGGIPTPGKIVDWRAADAVYPIDRVTSAPVSGTEGNKP